MKKFFQEHDVPRKLLAILLAMMLWTVVVTNTSAQRTETYHNIPVVFYGTDQLESEYGLKVIQGNDQKFSIRVSGGFETMSQFTRFGYKQANVSVNLSALNITEPGTYTVTRYDCQLNLRGSRIAEEAKDITYPASFEIVVDRIDTKEVPVSVQVEGAPPASYIYNDAETAQQSVTVTGPESVVSLIRKAVAIVPAADSDGLTKTTDLLVSFTFLDENGKPVDATYLSCEPGEATVRIPVYQVAKIPLTVDLVDSQNLSADSVDVKIEPAEISVYGDSDRISQLKEINLGKIVLGAVDLTEPKTLPIPKLDGITPLTGEPSTAKITLKAVGMSSREILVSKIALENTGEDETLQASLQTESLAVRLQAEASVLDSLTAEDILVRAVFDADSLGVGTHEVPVEIQPYGIAHFTVLNTAPTVTIEITQTQPEQAPSEPTPGEESPVPDAEPQAPAPEPEEEVPA